MGLIFIRKKILHKQAEDHIVIFLVSILLFALLLTPLYHLGILRAFDRRFAAVKRSKKSMQESRIPIAGKNVGKFWADDTEFERYDT